MRTMELALAAIVIATGCSEPVTYDTNDTVERTLAKGDGLYVLYDQCGGERDGLMPSVRADYQEFATALRDLNPEQFDRYGIPRPGRYKIPVALCPGAPTEYE